MFRRVERPTLMPARSLTGSTVGPQVDTEVILPNGGRVYLTEIEGWEVVNKFPTYSVQLGMRATEAGWTSPDLTDEIFARVADLEAQLADAQSEQPKMVALDDARVLLSEKSRGAKPMVKA